MLRRACLFVAKVALGLLACALLLFIALNGSESSDGHSTHWDAHWAGDVDGDGATDVWVSVDASGALCEVALLSGATLEPIDALHGVRTGTGRSENPVALGDLDHDGRDEVAFVDRGGWLHILPSRRDGRTPVPPLRVAGAGRAWRLGEIEGDGPEEILIDGASVDGQGPPALLALNWSDGHVLWSLPSTPAPVAEQDRLPTAGPLQACAIGDVDRDLVRDVAWLGEGDRVCIASGRTGEILARWPHVLERATGLLEPLPDLDGDGIDDLALYPGDSSAWHAGYGRGGWSDVQLVSAATGDVLTSVVVYGQVRDGFSCGDLNGNATSDFAVVSVALSWSWKFRIFEGSDGLLLRDLAGQTFSRGVGRHGPSAAPALLSVTNGHFECGVPESQDDWKSGHVKILASLDGTEWACIESDRIPR